MKKKLLSLMMAATMVATGTVSAFAQDYNFDESREQEAQIQITGDVQDDGGNILPGTISVTVPTTASFQVDNNNNVIGTEIEVRNTGNIPVDVSVNSFIDTTGENTGINVRSINGLASEDRTNVALRVWGALGTVYLSSSNTYKGVYSDADLRNPVNDTTNKVLKVDANTEGKLYLEGDAGQSGGSIPTAVRDNFTLTLKIAKAK